MWPQAERLVWLIAFIQHKDFVQAFEFATRLIQLRSFARLAKDIATHFNLLNRQGWKERLAAHGMEMTEAIPYLTSRTIAVWETLSNATGGVASLVTGKHPREVQRRAGLLRGRSRAAAAVASVLLFPALLLASAGADRPTGALYVEAERR